MINFDFFINPNHHTFKSDDFLDFDSLDYCSYVRYIVIPHFQIGIDAVPILIEDKDELSYYFNDDYSVFALNYLDNILLELKKL